MGLNKVIVPGYGFGAEVTLVVAASSASILPVGVILLRELATGLTVNYYNGTAWEAVIPAGSGGMVWSDGVNVQIANANTTNTDAYYMPIS